jgi:hypothetical protein
MSIYSATESLICLPTQKRGRIKMIYYVDNGERNDVGKPSAKKDYEQMEKSLKSVFGVEAQVRHYSQISVEEVKALNPQAAVLSGCGTPFKQFIKCDFSKEFELIRSGLLPILGNMRTGLLRKPAAVIRLSAWHTVQRSHPYSC